MAGDVASKDVEFYKQFSLVLVSNRSYEEQMKINEHCRSAGTMFVSCDVYGLCGYIFADLLDGFSYAEYALSSIHASSHRCCRHCCVNSDARMLAIYSEVAKGPAQSSSSQMKTTAFVSLRDAHADAWRRTREGNSRMPKLFATIAGRTSRQQYVYVDLSLTCHDDLCSIEPYACFFRGMGSCRNHAVYRERSRG